MKNVIDLTRFFDALQKIIPPDRRNAVQSLLVIGPGRHETLIDLLTLFPSAHITAVDIDQQVIAYLQEELGDGTGQITLVHGDARDVAGSFDLVIARHPDVDRRMESWKAVFESIAPLAQMVIITLYSLPEAAYINHVFESLPLDLRPGSPYTAAPVALQGNDRYIMVFTPSYSE